MQLSTRQVGSVSVIDISGKNPGARPPGLRDALTHLQGGGHRRIVLNLANLEYLDSSALGELVFCNTRASQSGTPLKLAGLTRRIQDLLRVTRLMTKFETYATVSEAVESFGPDEPPKW